MIVVDASALLAVLLRAPGSHDVAQVMFESPEALHAPHLLDVEVTQVLRRYAARGEVAPTRGREVLGDLASFPLLRHPHDFLLPRVWELRDNFSAYDAVYVALAEALDASLLTRDRRLSHAVAAHSSIGLL